MAREPRERDRERVRRARLAAPDDERSGTYRMSDRLGENEIKLVAGVQNFCFLPVVGERSRVESAARAVTQSVKCEALPGGLLRGAEAGGKGSHVLRALGLPDARVYTSLRFGIGRYNTPAEIDAAVDALAEAVKTARSRTSAVRD